MEPVIYLDGKSIPIPTLHIYCPDLGEIRYQSPKQDAAQHLWVPCKSASKRQRSSHGRKRKYIFACTMKPDDIQEVKNALVKCVHCVTEHKMCILIITFRDFNAHTYQADV